MRKGVMESAAAESKTARQKEYSPYATVHSNADKKRVSIIKTLLKAIIPIRCRMIVCLKLIKKCPAMLNRY